jgi:hypothetical protein
MARRKLLIVEDEAFIAMDIADTAEKVGFEVAGPFSRLEQVPQDLTGISAAILDLNVGGTSAYPLLDQLLERNIPVTLYTGYDANCGPEKYAKVSRVNKPSSCADAVKDVMRQLRVRASL